MTDTPDIEALIADLREVDNAMLTAAADALERQQARIALLEEHNDQHNRTGAKMARDNKAMEAVVKSAREKFEQIIRVRGGYGKLGGGDALNEMARLAGEALAALDAPPEGEG